MRIIDYLGCLGYFCSAEFEQMMKTEYKAPEVEFLKVETENLVCTSGERQDYEQEDW